MEVLRKKVSWPDLKVELFAVDFYLSREPAFPDAPLEFVAFVGPGADGLLEASRLGCIRPKILGF